MRALALCVLLCLAAGPAAAANIASACARPAGQLPPSAQVVAARQAERQACAADMASFCAGVPRGCGRPMQCLKAHAAQLSSACTSAISELRAAHHAQPR